MGIVLQILGLVITFTMAMEALRRFGIDVGWLNPLTFFHRRAWRKKVSTSPLYFSAMARILFNPKPWYPYSVVFVVMGSPFS